MNDIQIIFKVDDEVFYRAFLQKELANGSMLIESLDEWVRENIVEFGED